MRSRLFQIGGALLLVAVALPAAALSRAAAGPNLIRDGGFEQPLVGAGGYKVFSTGQGFAGWKVVGAAGNVAPISGAFQQNRIRFTAKSGKQWLDLTGAGSNGPTGVAQNVKTVAGARYRLSFAVGNVVDPGGLFGRSSTVTVLVNGHSVLKATNKGGGRVQGWKTFATTVKASSGTTSIEFLNGDPRSDNDNGLDAVSLTKS